MIAIGVALIARFLPAFPGPFVGPVLAVLGVVAALGVPYLAGRSHGAEACESRHEAARLEAEEARKASEAEARLAAAKEDAAAKDTELSHEKIVHELVNTPGCIDGQWLFNGLARLR